MGQKPAFIGGIAVKTKADVVIHAAPAHMLQGGFCHLQCSGVMVQLAVAQQKNKIVG